MPLQVQAHGGGLLKVKDIWYWFGESYKRPLLGDFLSEGVNLYSSTGDDLPWPSCMSRAARPSLSSIMHGCICIMRVVNQAHQEC